MGDVMVEMAGKGKKIGGDVHKCMAGIKCEAPFYILNWFLILIFTVGLYRRFVICKYIWPYMLGMCLTYMVTLTLYPGVETLITSCHMGSWTVIILMAVFNISDLVGKITAGMTSSMSPITLVTAPLARLILIPLLLLAASR